MKQTILKLTFKVSRDSQAVILAIISVLLWSTVATAFKIALRELNFVQVLAISTYVSTFIFFVLFVFKNKFCFNNTFNTKDLKKSALLGFLNPFLYYIVLLKAYSILPAFMAQPLNYTWPIVLVFFSAWFLKQKLSVLSLVALVISLIGVFFISVSNNSSQSELNLLGILLATGSSIVWSFYWIFNVKDVRPVHNKMFLNFLFSSIYITIILVILNLYKITLSTSFFASIYLGFFEMGITFILWLTALEKSTRTDKISIYIFLSPLISLFLISTVLKEKITFYALIGFFFILLGILITKINELKTIFSEKKR